MWRLLSAGNLMDVAWNPFLSRELLYARSDCALFSVSLPQPAQTRPCPTQPQVSARGGRRGQKADGAARAYERAQDLQVMQAATKEVLRHESLQNCAADRVSVACAGGARKVTMSVGRWLLTGQVCCSLTSVLHESTCLWHAQTGIASITLQVPHNMLKLLVKLCAQSSCVRSQAVCVVSQVCRSRATARAQPWRTAYKLPISGSIRCHCDRRRVDLPRTRLWSRGRSSAADGTQPARGVYHTANAHLPCCAADARACRHAATRHAVAACVLVASRVASAAAARAHGSRRRVAHACAARSRGARQSACSTCTGGAYRTAAVPWPRRCDVQSDRADSAAGLCCAPTHTWLSSVSP